MDKLEWFPMDFTYRVYCPIHRKKVLISDKAYTSGLCAMAYRLRCGHIMVDDCNPKQLGGSVFESESDWESKLNTPWAGEGNYPGKDFVNWAKVREGRDSNGNSNI